MVFFSCRAALTDLAESTSSLFHAPFVPVFLLIFRFLFELPLSPCTLPLHAIFLDLTTKYRRLEGGRGGGRRGPVGREARCYDHERLCCLLLLPRRHENTGFFFPHLHLLLVVCSTYARRNSFWRFAAIALSALLSPCARSAAGLLSRLRHLHLAKVSLLLFFFILLWFRTLTFFLEYVF